jgi:hypothetical protein
MTSSGKHRKGGSRGSLPDFPLGMPGMSRVGCRQSARRRNRTGVLSGAIPSRPVPGRGRVESDEEIMNILEAYDLTGALRDAAELAGCSHHTVARYVAERERSQAGRRAAGTIDEFMPKLEGVPVNRRLALNRLGAEMPEIN